MKGLFAGDVCLLASAPSPFAAQPAADPQPYPWIAEHAQDAADLLTSNRGSAWTAPGPTRPRPRLQSAGGPRPADSVLDRALRPCLQRPFLLLASDSRAQDCARHCESESQQRCVQGPACCPSGPSMGKQRSPVIGCSILHRPVEPVSNPTIPEKIAICFPDALLQRVLVNITDTARQELFPFDPEVTEH